MSANRPRRRTVDRAGWLEVRCSLFPQPAHPGLFVDWSSLGEAIERWRVEGRYRWCFFVRKPPGLRVRFAGDDVAGRLEPVLLPWLAEAERRNDIRGFRFTTYEPEEARFGGPVGMAIAHDAFDVDSRDAIRYERLSEDQRPGFSRQTFSVAACSHLFRHSLGDQAEIWDVWQRLGRVVGSHPVGPGTDGRAVESLAALALANGAAPDLTQLSADARLLLQERFERNLGIAGAIVAAANTGRLNVGLRAWLTALTIFHWNRVGLVHDLPGLAGVVADLCRALEPDT